MPHILHIDNIDTWRKLVPQWNCCDQQYFGTEIEYSQASSLIKISLSECLQILIVAFVSLCRGHRGSIFGSLLSARSPGTMMGETINPDNSNTYLGPCFLNLSLGQPAHFLLQSHRPGIVQLSCSRASQPGSCFTHPTASSHVSYRSRQKYDSPEIPQSQLSRIGSRVGVSRSLTSCSNPGLDPELTTAQRPAHKLCNPSSRINRPCDTAKPRSRTAWLYHGLHDEGRGKLSSHPELPWHGRHV